MKDAMDALLKMNDNDIMDALRYKKKKSRQFNENELAEMLETDTGYEFALLDKSTGAFYEDDSMFSSIWQDGGDEHDD